MILSSPSKFNLFLISFFIYFLVQCQINNAQTVVKYRTTNKPDTGSNPGCEFKLHVILQYTQPLYASDITITPSTNFLAPIGAPPASLVSQTDLNNQIFTLSYYAQPSLNIELRLKIVNASQSLNVEIPLNPTFYYTCISVQSLQLKVGQFSNVTNNNNLVQLPIEYNFNYSTGYRSVSCTTDTVVLCNCNLNSVVLNINKWTCDFYTLLPSGNPPTSMIVKFIVLSMQSLVTLKNPFYISKDSRTSITSTYYPSNLYSIAEDFRLQRDPKISLPAYQIVSTQSENTGFILYNDDPKRYFILNQKNGTDLTFSYATEFSIDTKMVSFGSSIIGYPGKSFKYASYVSSLSYLQNVRSFQMKWELNQQIETSLLSTTIKNDSLPYVHNYTFQYKIFDRVIEMPLPYPKSSSYKFNGIALFSYDFSILLYFKFLGPIPANLIPLGISTTPTITSNVQMPASTITINDIDYELYTPSTYMVKLSINSNYAVSMISFAGQYFNQSNLVSGDEFIGIYKFEMPIKSNLTSVIDLKIYNERGYSQTYYEGTYFNTAAYFKSPPSDSSNIVGIQDFTYFKFLRTEIDLTNGPVNNSLHFAVSKNVTSMLPYIVFDLNNEYLYQGAFDKSLNLFVINFTMETWMVDNSFKLGDLFNYFTENITSQRIALQFNSSVDTILSINNPGMNTYPPYMAGLSVQSSSASLTWTFTINSSPNNPFKSGVFEIIGEFDAKPFIVDLYAANRISGDEYSGKYSITIIVPSQNCRSQKFVINKAYLRGTGGVVQQVDATYRIINSASATNLTYFRECIGSGGDSVAPSLDYFRIITDSVQVGGSDRKVIIRFSTKDNDGGSGISPRNLPIVYLTSQDTSTFIIESKLDIINGVYNYTAEAQLPYGFGSRNICVSLYGIADYQNNYKGFSINDINFVAYPYSPCINRLFDPKIPVLERASPVTSQGGWVTILGRTIDTNSVSVTIDYKDGNGKVPIIQVTSKPFILINVKPFKKITVQAKNNGYLSNELDITAIETYIIPPIPIVTPSPNVTDTPSPSPNVTDTPSPSPNVTNTPSPSPNVTDTPSPSPNVTNTPAPTGSPSLCPGTTACNNRGDCTPRGCNCRLPWTGPSCSSEIIPVPEPPVQPEPTTETIITVNTTIVSSIVSVAEVREIDSDGNLVQRYTINNWNLKNLTSNSSDIPTYLYSAQLNSSIPTNITTKIEFFKNQTDIKFGNEIIQVLPSSIKFSIQLYAYSFEKQTNYLQIIMESTIKGGDDDSCSSTQIGSESQNSRDNVHWIKMNIDKTSLYGRFIDFGIVDGRVTNISNRIINEEDSINERSVKIAIIVPYYEKDVYLDPDFSNLIDIDEDNLDYLCKSKKKLSSGAIAGIVVGAIVFVSIVGAVIMVIYKRHIRVNEERRVESKLKKLQK